MAEVKWEESATTYRCVPATWVIVVYTLDA